MPVQHHIHVIEYSGPREIDLARAAFLRRGAVDAYRTSLAGVRQPGRYGGARGDGRRTEKMMTAGVPTRPRSIW